MFLFKNKLCLQKKEANSKQNINVLTHQQWISPALPHLTSWFLTLLIHSVKIKSVYSVEGKTKQTVGNQFYSGICFHFSYSCRKQSRSEWELSSQMNPRRLTADQQVVTNKPTDHQSAADFIVTELVQRHRVFKVLLHHNVESSVFISSLWTFTTLTNCHTERRLLSLFVVEDI